MRKTLIVAALCSTALLLGTPLATACWWFCGDDSSTVQVPQDQLDQTCTDFCWEQSSGASDSSRGTTEGYGWSLWEVANEGMNEQYIMNQESQNRLNSFSGDSESECC